MDGVAAIFVTAGNKTLTAVAKDRKMLVPAGEARVIVYSMRKTDGDGISWALMGMPGGEMKAAVEKGKSVAVAIGPPISLTAKCDQGDQVKAGTKAKLTPVIEDRSGGRIQVLPLGKQARPADTFIVVRQNGKEIARGKCEPG